MLLPPPRSPSAAQNASAECELQSGTQVVALQELSQSVSRTVSASEGSMELTPGGSLGAPAGASATLSGAGGSGSGDAAMADSNDIDGGGGGGDAAASGARPTSSSSTASDAMQRAVLMRSLSSISRPTDSEVRREA